MSDELKDELKDCDGTKIERGVEGVKLAVLYGAVSGGFAYRASFYVGGTWVSREDFDTICKMLALKGTQL